MSLKRVHGLGSNSVTFMEDFGADPLVLWVSVSPLESEGLGQVKSQVMSISNIHCHCAS